MSTLRVIHLTLSTALPIAVQYVPGTPTGQPLEQRPTFTSTSSVWAFAGAVVLGGLLCVTLRVERSAFSICKYYARDRYARASIYECPISCASQILRSVDRDCALRHLAEDGSEHSLKLRHAFSVG